MSTSASPAAEPPSPWTKTLRWLRGEAEAVQTDLAGYRLILDAVNRHGEALRGETDDALKSRGSALRLRVRDGEALDTLLPEAFALVREAADRTIGLRPYDTQVIAAIVLFEGRLAQMKTGEGKTLAAVLAASLVGLTGRGVHILTFNDYLAGRDAEWMGPVYRFLGLTVGVVQQGMPVEARRRAYQADITYATAREAGFDLLRIQLVRDPTQVAHRGLHYAIVDEADSILVDEARIPLVIAGQRLDSGASRYLLAAAVGALEPTVDFEVDDDGRSVFLTERGCDRLEAELDRGDLYSGANGLLLAEIHQALHARALLQCGVDYIVRNEKIELVDAFTGRVVHSRRWPDGLHAAVEAKEGLPIQKGGRILGSMSLQHLLERYEILSGMTATAVSAAEELSGFYGLKVVVLPENRPCIREDMPDRVFTHREAKIAALITEIRDVNASGRPVLVGTRSVEESDRLAARLREDGIVCQVLNARNDAEEAGIIAEAGALGAVTISTNMAGRGTDIRLGGADEREREVVLALGGLYVIGTNRHESRRIDNQLRGRSGRQGDPGTSRFFVSLEDDLMVRFGIDRFLESRFVQRQDTNIDHPVVQGEIERLQRNVEGQNYDVRRALWKYASVVEQQSGALHDFRSEVLHGRLSSMCEERSPQQWSVLKQALGQVGVEEIERQITLHHIDLAWEEHLALTSELRESIHLVKLAGEPPLETFRKRSLQAYWALEERLDEQIIGTFDALRIGPSGDVDLASHGLTPPSATWTYLVDDQGPSGLLAVSGIENPAAGLGAIIAFPLVIVGALWRRWRKD